MLKAIVIEDEAHAREELKFLLNETKKFEIIGEAERIHEALWLIQERQPDVVFLDIELAQGTGIELAKQFTNFKSKPLIVFVTAYDEYAIEAFELDAIDYLLKPISEKRLYKTINKLEKMSINKLDNSLNNNRSSKQFKNILVEDAGRMILIKPKDIYYVGTENRKVFIKTKEQRYPVDSLLYQVKEKLNNDFIQVHRGNIVNLTKVSAIEPWFNGAYNLLLKDGSRVPVSRSYAKNLRNVLDF